MKTRTHHLLEKVAALYNFDAQTISLIDSNIYSPNDIYTFTKKGICYILRIATHNENNLSNTIAEMEWLDFLYKKDIPVSMPLPMNDGQLVTSFVVGDKHHAVCAFEKANGVHCDKDDPNTWNTHIIEDYGFVMGCMHRETKNFQPSDTCYMRGVFDGSEVFDDSLSQVPTLAMLAEEIIPQLLALPRTSDTFGLIHHDFHINNSFVWNSINKLISVIRV
jgi:Ser/Thr protein kinase RdoA (MazF antagonist)